MISSISRLPRQENVQNAEVTFSVGVEGERAGVAGRLRRVDGFSFQRLSALILSLPMTAGLPSVLLPAASWRAAGQPIRQRQCRQFSNSVWPVFAVYKFSNDDAEAPHRPPF